MVEGARLESVYTVTPYRGFESLSLRHFIDVEIDVLEGNRLESEGDRSIKLENNSVVHSQK